MPTTNAHIDIDSIQGTAVILLDSQGSAEAAELLELAELSYGEDWKPEYAYDEDGYPTKVYLTPKLFVDPHLMASYTKEVSREINEALEAVTKLEPYALDYPVVAPRKVGPGWREARQQERLSGINNQAHRQPLDKPHPVKDGLHFRDNAEVLVYDGLVALAESRPKSDTISITVNAPVRVAGRTFIPDFIVTFRHRAGIIEVDGATHDKRYLSDASKNELFIDAGFLVVYRIPAEETDRPELVKSHLDTFLRRLLAR